MINNKTKCKIGLYIIIVFLMTSLLQKYVFYLSLIPSSSMNPNLREGDKVLVNRISPNYNRGSIIIFNYDGQTMYCKRLIGLPGEKLEIKSGNIYINGIHYNETFEFTGKYDKDIAVTLEDDEYYVLGDNRAASKDSRFFGPIKKFQLIGSVPFKFFPFKTF